MTKYYRNTSYSRRRSPSYRGGASRDAIEHVRQYNELAARLGPIVNDVRQAFFNLSIADRKLLLSEYRHKYGDKASKYAEDAFPYWKSGQRKMSGQTAERLLNLVPKYLSNDQRYQAVKRLCEYHSQKIHRTITIDKKNTAAGLVEVDKAIGNFRSGHTLKYLPGDVLETVTWLHDADAVASRGLLAQIDSFMHQQVEGVIRRNRELISNFINQESTKGFSETFNFPNGTLRIQMNEASACFVATAVFGDSFHPTVIELRSYRDKVLTKSRLGRTFISVYYCVGPYLADIVKSMPALRWATRHMLNGIINRMRRSEKK